MTYVHSKARNASQLVQPLILTVMLDFDVLAPSLVAGPQHFLGTSISGHVRPVQSQGSINATLCTVESVVEDGFRYLAVHYAGQHTRTAATP